MPLVLTTKMAAHTYSVSGNHWPREPRDLRKTTSAHKFCPAFGATSKTCIFYKYIVFKHSSSFTQILHSEYTVSLQCDILLIHQQEWKAKKWINLADIHFFNIHWLRDFFQSQRNQLLRTTKRKRFKYVTQLNRTFPSLTFLQFSCVSYTHTYTHDLCFMYQCLFYYSV